MGRWRVVAQVGAGLFIRDSDSKNKTFGTEQEAQAQIDRTRAERGEVRAACLRVAYILGRDWRDGEQWSVREAVS